MYIGEMYFPYQFLIVVGLVLGVAFFIAWSGAFINNGKPVLSANDKTQRPNVEWVSE